MSKSKQYWNWSDDDVTDGVDAFSGDENENRQDEEDGGFDGNRYSALSTASSECGSVPSISEESVTEGAGERNGFSDEEIDDMHSLPTETLSSDSDDDDLDAISMPMDELFPLKESAADNDIWNQYSDDPYPYPPEKEEPENQSRSTALIPHTSKKKHKRAKREIDFPPVTPQVLAKALPWQSISLMPIAPGNSITVNVNVYVNNIKRSDEFGLNDFLTKADD